MLKIFQLLLLAALSSGCFSIKIPLNVPPKMYHFSEDKAEDVAGSQVDSSKSSILTPILLFGGTGQILGAASYTGGSDIPTVREKLISSNAFVSGGIGAMVGLVVGHSQWKRRVTAQSAEGYNYEGAMDSSANHLPKSLIKATLVGTGVGYALGSLIDGGQKNNFSSEAWLGRGAFIGGLLGAGYGNLLTRLSNNGAFGSAPTGPALPEKADEGRNGASDGSTISKKTGGRRMPKKAVLIPGIFCALYGGYVGNILAEERNDYYSGPPSFSSRVGGVIEGASVGAVIGSALGLTLYGIKSVFTRPKKVEK